MKIKFSKKLIPIFLLLILIVACWITARSSHRGNNHSISISGNIEMTEVDVSFKVSGKIVDIAVSEGDEVKKGIVIARLDQEQLLNQRDKAQAVLAGTEARVGQLKTAIQYLKETVKGHIAIRKAELAQTEVRLQELLTGSRTQEIEQARALMDKARTEYENAKKDWERAEALYKDESIAASRYDQSKTVFEGAQASLKKAEEQLALVLEGPRQEDKETARIKVSQSKTALKLAESQRLEIKMKEEELAIALTDIDRAKADLALIETQLRDTIAQSSIDGVVLVKAAEIGEVLAAGAIVVSIGDIYHPWVRGYIDERDIDRVKLGAKVKVTTDSGKVFQGVIGFISPKAEFTPKQIQTQEERVKLVYRIKVNIENPRGELKMNMPVDAEIIL